VSHVVKEASASCPWCDAPRGLPWPWRPRRPSSPESRRSVCDRRARSLRVRPPDRRTLHGTPTRRHAVPTPRHRRAMRLARDAGATAARAGRTATRRHADRTRRRRERTVCRARGIAIPCEWHRVRRTPRHATAPLHGVRMRRRRARSGPRPLPRDRAPKHLRIRSTASQASLYPAARRSRGAVSSSPSQTTCDWRGSRCDAGAARPAWRRAPSRMASQRPG